MNSPVQFGRPANVPDGTAAHFWGLVVGGIPLLTTAVFSFDEL